jgi:hypothetical protein
VPSARLARASFCALAYWAGPALGPAPAAPPLQKSSRYLRQREAQRRRGARGWRGRSVAGQRARRARGRGVHAGAACVRSCSLRIRYRRPVAAARRPAPALAAVGPLIAEEPQRDVAAAAGLLDRRRGLAAREARHSGGVAARLAPEALDISRRRRVGRRPRAGLPPLGRRVVARCRLRGRRPVGQRRARRRRPATPPAAPQRTLAASGASLLCPNVNTAWLLGPPGLETARGGHGAGPGARSEGRPRLFPGAGALAAPPTRTQAAHVAPRDVGGAPRLHLR